jgi:hypothetical protein
LNYTASDSQYKVVEPSVCDNKLVIEGTPLSTLVNYEKFKNNIINKKSWLTISSKASSNPM